MTLPVFSAPSLCPECSSTLVGGVCLFCTEGTCPACFVDYPLAELADSGLCEVCALTDSDPYADEYDDPDYDLDDLDDPDDPHSAVGSAAPHYPKVTSMPSSRHSRLSRPTFHPARDLVPAPALEPSLLVSPGSTYSKRRPPASRVAAPCPFPAALPKRLVLVSLVTPGNSSPNVAAALGAWQDSLGEPLPKDLSSLAPYRAHPVKDKFVTESLFSSLEAQIRTVFGDAYCADVYLDSTFTRPESTLLVSDWATISGYAYGSYATKRTAHLLAEVLTLFSLPAARSAGGILEITARSKK